MLLAEPSGSSLQARRTVAIKTYFIPAARAAFKPSGAFRAPRAAGVKQQQRRAMHTVCNGNRWLRNTWRRHKLGILGEAALGLHADFEGVQWVDRSLAGGARYCSRKYVARRLGVDLNIQHLIRQASHKYSPFLTRWLDAFAATLENSRAYTPHHHKTCMCGVPM